MIFRRAEICSLRGVRASSLNSLQRKLDDLDLIEAEDGPAAARAILISPLAGLDPAAILDIRPSANLLRERIAYASSLARLPAKFGFAIDDGGLLPLPAEAADISFIVRRSSGDERYFIVHLGGGVAGRCRIDELPDVAVRLCNAFLAMRGEDGEAPRRMKDLVDRVGAQAIVRGAKVTEIEEHTERRDQPPRVIGKFRAGDWCVSGVGIAFGRLDFEVLNLLAEAAELSDGELRLTPWRALLIVGRQFPELRKLAELGLIIDDGDPLRLIAACTGAPGCKNGTTQTHVDARRLAALATQIGGQGIALHVSGCVKGCAHPAPAPLTLVARSGRYDLVLRGRPEDKTILSGIEASELELVLSQFSMGISDGRYDER